VGHMGNDGHKMIAAWIWVRLRVENGTGPPCPKDVWINVDQGGFEEMVIPSHLNLSVSHPHIASQTETKVRRSAKTIVSSLSGQAHVTGRERVEKMTEGLEFEEPTS